MFNKMSISMYLSIINCKQTKCLNKKTKKKKKERET